MYKYKGDGWIVGVPARDLTEQEFQRLDKDLQEKVKASIYYELVKKQSVKDAQEK